MDPKRLDERLDGSLNTEVTELILNINLLSDDYLSGAKFRLYGLIRERDYPKISKKTRSNMSATFKIAGVQFQRIYRLSLS